MWLFNTKKPTTNSASGKKNVNLTVQEENDLWNNNLAATSTDADSVKKYKDTVAEIGITSIKQENAQKNEGTPPVA